MAKVIKKIISLFIIIILAGQSFAAVVSDNDGSAFVTKSEFEAMKKDFEEQITIYNDSIDGKIDGAIASYLAGIKTATVESHEVAYFKTFDDDTTICTMQPYNAFAFGYGNPDVSAGFNFCSVYTHNGSSKFYKGTANATFSYSGNTNAKRRFVSKFKIGTADKFRWVGYTTNYQERFSISWIYNGGDTDTGFTNAAPYLYVFGRSDFTETTSTKNEDASFWTNIKGRLGDTSTVHGVFSPQFCTVETKWNNYDIKNKKDLIYSDYTSTTQAASDFKAFQEKNPDNRWFAGSNSTYQALEQAGSVSGDSVVQYGGNGWDRMSSYGIQPTVYNNSNTSSYASKKFFACGFEPDVKYWKDVYANDNTKYIDNLQASKTFQNYTMIDGMALIEAEKNTNYEWTVKFNDTADTNVWIKYGVFDGVPVEGNCISVKVDNETTESKVALIKNGKGKIKFKAEKAGLVFAKWSSGKSMIVADSKTIIAKRNSNED